jgi:exo-beta-1,3-glucanase (GH17 family)
MHFLRLVAAVFLAGIAAGAVWWFADRPVPVAAEWSQPFSSISFAAYRRGESPLTGRYPTPAEIEQDMAILVGRTHGIRTYTTHEGLEVVPALAEKYGLKVTLGCWLGADLALNEREVAALIEQANAHPDSVQRVMVGNEVLLRGDLTPDQLIGYVRRVKAAIKQPVSTADGVSFVLKYPQVGRELDYITVHILPFWDDYPLGVDEIERDTVAVIDRMRETFPGKPILIGETGWPSIGRNRGPAAVTVASEADFVRRMAKLAAEHDFDYNIVEAFDQPWKSALEGTVGAAWGVMEAERVHGDGVMKFPMTGPVPQVADWPIRAGWAIALGVVATLLFARSLPSFAATLGFALAAQILSWLMITTIFHAHEVTYRPWQYWWLILRIALPALLFGAMAARLRDWLIRDDSDGARLWLGRLVMPATAAYAIAWSLLLFFDGYYRDIPELDFCLPVGGLLTMAVIRLSLARHPGESWREALSIAEIFPGWHDRRLSLAIGWLLVVMAPLTLVGESWALAVGRDFITAHPTFTEQLPYLIKGLVWNREMDLWSAMQLLWAVPFLLARTPEERKGPA